MGTIKDRNGEDLTEKKRLRRGGKNTQNCTVKILMTQISMLVWSLTQNQTSWSMKSSGSQETLLGTKLVEVMKFQVMKFQILKDDAVKVLHSTGQQIWKTQKWSQNWKSQFSFQSQRRAMPKNESSNYYIIVLVLHASIVMLKILQARLKQFVNQECPDVQAGFRRSRVTKDQIASSHWITQKSKRIPEKHLLLLH